MKAELITGTEAALQKTTVNQSIAEENAFKDKLTQAQKAANSGDKTTDAASAAKAAVDDKKLRKVCRDMESMFMNMLLTSMRETVPEGGLIEKSSGEKIMQSMLDQELSNNMAKAGGIGIADMLHRQLAAKTYQNTAKAEAGTTIKTKG